MKKTKKIGKIVALSVIALLLVLTTAQGTPTREIITGRKPDFQGNWGQMPTRNPIGQLTGYRNALATLVTGKQSDTWLCLNGLYQDSTILIRFPMRSMNGAFRGLLSYDGSTDVITGAYMIKSGTLVAFFEWNNMQYWIVGTFLLTFCS